MRVVPEGSPFIAVGVVTLAALVGVAWLAGGGLWMILPAAWLPVAVWIPIFFRDPVRSGPRSDRVLVAPADGRVVSVLQTDETEFLGGPAVRVSVFMNVFDVHVNRLPASGTVQYRRYRPGRFFNATLDKASEVNEQMALGIGTPRGRVLVRQIAGLVARRIVTDPQLDEQVVQGERLGLIRFGSRVDTFFGLEVVPRVAVGDRTVAGVTVIGEWTS